MPTALSFWSSAKRRKKKSIGVLAPRRGRFEHLELAVQNGQVGVGRDHVNAVRLDLHSVLHFDDLHLGMSSEEFRHHALTRWLKMLHQDECHPCSWRQVGKELLECLQAACNAPMPTT